MFTIVHPIMAYYQDLPADNDDVPKHLIPNIKWNERLKQSWAFMFSDMNEDILEIGCGNTSVCRHINKIISPIKTHHMIVHGAHENLMLPSQISLLHSPPPQYNTVIVHYDHQDLFVKHAASILQTAKVLVLEVDNKVLIPLIPLLSFLKFKKTHRYIYLSVWQKCLG